MKEDTKIRKNLTIKFNLDQNLKLQWMSGATTVRNKDLLRKSIGNSKPMEQNVEG